MKKIKNKENIFNILIILLLFISSFSIIIIRKIDNLDELWNYNFARNISNGLIPYRDFNMVITPLYSFIGGIILRLTTDTIIIMRLCAALLLALILYIIHKILNVLKIKREVSFIFISICFVLFKDFFAFDYNWLSLFLTLVILYNEVKAYKVDNEIFNLSFRQNFLIGIIAGMSVINKQTVGVLTAFTFLTNKIMFIKNKDDIKKFFKIFSYRLIGILILVILCSIYLIINNAFREFISYTIKGTKEFSNFYAYSNLIKFDIVGILAVLLPIIIIIEIGILVFKTKNIEKYFLLVYGLSMLILIYPISDITHFLIGSAPLIILALYEMYNLLYVTFKDNTKLTKYICRCISVMIIIALFGYVLNNFLLYNKNKKNHSNIKQYKNIYVSNSIQSQLKDVDEYILNTDKDIKILDSSAVLFMIPIGRYNKDYDMFNKGNFGENGEKRLIDDIKQAKNRQYLLLKEEHTLNWQTPTNILEYVKKNKSKVGEVSIFDIYE